MSQLRFLLVLPCLLLRNEYSDACTEIKPLGVASGEVQDTQLTASSVYPFDWDKDCQVKYARLYQPNKRAWCSRFKTVSEWLQIDLGVTARVSAVTVQGRGDGQEWVRFFKLSYSTDLNNWHYINDQYNNQKILAGNTDSFSLQNNFLETPVVGRYFRFHPVQWQRHPSMRVELHGCYICKEFLGTPPYGRMDASSSARSKDSSTCQPYDGTFVSSKAWCAKTRRNQWIQVDVGPPTSITGIVTKGRGDTRRKQWVTSYQVAFSNTTDDKALWRWVVDETDHDRKASRFVANRDRNTPSYHFFNHPFVARYVRFYPVTWKHKVAMRVAVLGCSFRGQCHDEFMSLSQFNSVCIENKAFKRLAGIGSQNGKTKRNTKPSDKITGRVGSNKSDSSEQRERLKAARLVDGSLVPSSCLTIENKPGERGVSWWVNLGNRRLVKGVTIHQAPETAAPLQRIFSPNIRKMVVYVTYHQNRRRKEHICRTLTRNEISTNSVLHFECMEPLEGRYVIVYAKNNPEIQKRKLKINLCEVKVY